MKKSLVLSIPMVLGCLVSASAVTTAFTPATFSSAAAVPPDPAPPGPTIVGGLITLTTAANSESNVVGFDRSDAGTYAKANFSFTSRIATGGAGTADGYTFGFGNTGMIGTTGPGVNTGEEGNFAGGLGISFDTWNNTGPDPGPDGGDLDQISLHFNNAKIISIDDTRLLTPSLTIDDGQAHQVTGTVNFAAATVSLSVDGNAIFTNQPIPGLAPYESRIFFSGRTGGENELVEIGGLNVSFVPEPGSALLCLLGLAGIVRRRR